MSEMPDWDEGTERAWEERRSPAAPPPDVTCPDCRTGTLVEGYGCRTCGLTWEDLLASEEFLLERALEQATGKARAKIEKALVRYR